MTEMEFDALVLKLRERSNWSDYSEQILRRCWKGGFQVERLIDQNYNGKQMRELCVGLESGVDIDQFADVAISARKMQEIRESLPSLFRSIDVLPDPITVPAPAPSPARSTKAVPLSMPCSPASVTVEAPVNDPMTSQMEPLAKLAKSDETIPKASEDESIIVEIDNPTHWSDIEIRESDLANLTPMEFCRRAGISGADHISIDKKDFLSLKSAKDGMTISLSIRIRDRSYVLLAEVVGNESLNAAQLEQICRARDAGLPYHLLVGFEADQMHEIRLGLMTLDQSIVELYAKNHFSAAEMRYLRWAAGLGYQPEHMSMMDASAFALKKLTESFPFFPISVFRGIYDQDQINIFISMWNEGLRDVIPSLARMRLSADQLREVREGLLFSCRAISYAHSEFSPDQMHDMRLELMKSIGTKDRIKRQMVLLRNKKSQHQQVNELRSIQSK